MDWFRGLSAPKSVTVMANAFEPPTVTAAVTTNNISATPANDTYANDESDGVRVENEEQLEELMTANEQRQSMGSMPTNTAVADLLAAAANINADNNIQFGSMPTFEQILERRDRALERARARITSNNDSSNRITNENDSNGNGNGNGNDNGNGNGNDNGNGDNNGWQTVSNNRRDFRTDPTVTPSLVARRNLPTTNNLTGGQFTELEPEDNDDNAARPTATNLVQHKVHPPQHTGSSEIHAEYRDSLIEYSKYAGWYDALAIDPVYAQENWNEIDKLKLMEKQHMAYQVILNSVKINQNFPRHMEPYYCDI